MRAAKQWILIPGWVPAQLANSSHGHWSTRQRKLKAAQIMVWAAAKQAGTEPILGRARVVITLTFGVNRRRDTDNMYSRCKGLLDGLVKGGWIKDDSIEWLELSVKAAVCKGELSTLIELEPDWVKE